MADAPNAPLTPLDTFLDAARARIRRGPGPGTEIVALEQAAGRVLAEPIHAPGDLPPFRASAMDGWAVSAAGADGAGPGAGRSLRVVGTAAAGHPWPGTVGPDEAVRIFTGAVVPEGADAVVPQERARPGPGDRVEVTLPEAGTFVRPVGNDATAGTEILPAPLRLRPAAIGALAAAGRVRVPVHRPCRVSLFSTGDELVPAAAEPGPGQLRDSNGPALAAAVRARGCTLMRHVRLPDDVARTRTALLDAAADSDVLVTIGGASVGDADHVVEVLRQVGELDHWRLAIRPGKPFAFGRIGDAWLCGLPGNPASALVTWQVLVEPLLAAWHRLPEAPLMEAPARLCHAVRPDPARTEFARGRLEAGSADGMAAVRLTGSQDSARLSGVAVADVLVRLSPRTAPLPAGTVVPVRPLTPI